MKSRYRACDVKIARLRWVWDHQISARVTWSDKVVDGFAGWLETKVITFHYTFSSKVFDGAWRYSTSMIKVVFFCIAFLSFASGCSSSFVPRGR